MTRVPIRVRLTLAFALVMALVFAAVGAVLYVRLGDTLDERIADSLEARTTALASTFDVTSPVVAGEEGLAQVLEADGSVIAGSSAVAERPLLTAAQLHQALTDSPVVDTNVAGVDFRLLATPVDDRIVVVGEPLDDRDEALDGLLTQLLVVLPIALLVSSAIGYLVAGAALRPVEDMRRRAADISAETLERRLPLPQTRDEIYRLGATLNEMLDRLDEGLARERRFVADASHELRTPLATLQTELELATRRPRSQDELEDALRSASEEVQRLVRLAEELLVLARADEGQLVLRAQQFVVRDALEAVAARYGSQAAATDRALEVSAPADLTLTGDRQRIEQAVGNLVENALRHGLGTVRLQARADDSLVVLAVSDEGAGFAPEFLPHAFERFSRADASRTGRGVGLGLAIVDAISRAHGGRATASNRDGAGPIVTIAVPADRDPTLAAHGLS